MDQLIGLGRDALLLAVTLSLPALAVAALVGFFTSAAQSATHTFDVALGHLPRLLAVAVAIALSASWMASQILAFAERTLTSG